MRIRNDEHYVERGMKIQPVGWAGRYWRSGGAIVILITYLLIAFRWRIAFTVWALFMAGVIFVTTLFVAAMLDVKEKE